MHLPLTQRNSWGRQRPGALVGVAMVLDVVLVLLLELLIAMRSRSRCCARAEGGIALAVRVGIVAVDMLNLLVVRLARWAEYLNLFSESLVIMISLLSRKLTRARAEMSQMWNESKPKLTKALGPAACCRLL